MATCPTCGHSIPERRKLLNAQELLAELQTGKEVYAGCNGGWWLTCGRGEVDPSAVRELRHSGVIQQVYSNTDDAWHIGKTLDIDATLAARREHGKNAQRIYTDGSAEPYKFRKAG